MLLGSIVVSIGAMVVLCLILRRSRPSLGMPIAYLGLLLLNHLPGAIAHAAADELTVFEVLTPTQYTLTGMMFTAIGACCFVVGVGFAHWRRPTIVFDVRRLSPKFPQFCLYGGWIVTFFLLPIANIPSIGAAVDKAGALWILGALIGLRDAMHAANARGVLLWLSALFVYPLFILIFAGFLSYGTAAMMIAMSVLAVSSRSIVRVWLSILLIGVLGLTVFANYFVARKEIRAVTWSNAGLFERVSVTINAFSDFEFIALSNPKHLNALDQRLNQNYFVGVAASRLDDGSAEYINGRSLVEAAMSLVPRAIWPDKPVYGGSPAIVREMTGLELSETTSWGVGNVMEFYINFGIPGLFGGFLLLGLVLGRMDRNAAVALGRGDHGGAIAYFLPAVALIQPLGSLVELASGAAAAFVAALVWKWAWEVFVMKRQPRARRG